mmetsp:Transcript_31273/g.50393  ORF Transcript_31273/g.50393 Transcript_31273/m.50393 type:complete len:204 (-) Transcript_31273:1318-1929(-)
MVERRVGEDKAGVKVRARIKREAEVVRISALRANRLQNAARASTQRKIITIKIPGKEGVQGKRAEGVGAEEEVLVEEEEEEGVEETKGRVVNVRARRGNVIKTNKTSSSSSKNNSQIAELGEQTKSRSEPSANPREETKIIKTKMLLAKIEAAITKLPLQQQLHLLLQPLLLVLLLLKVVTNSSSIHVPPRGKGRIDSQRGHG